MKSPSNASAARILAIAALVVVTASAAYYVVSAVPPYGFYYDLGANVAATSMISNWMRGFADVWDAFGWAGWGERTPFTYAPMTVYGIAVPIAKILGGNAFAAIKAMQVIDLATAWASAAYLYAVLRGRSAWAWIAGLLYALLPEHVLMIRGNIEFGFVSALVPLALACPIVLVRRYGLAALPFCGALVGLFTTDMVVEYGIFVGIPAVLTAIGQAYERAQRFRWFAFSALSLIAFAAVAAYTAVPTIASHALFSPPVSTDAALQSGQFSVFAESPLALASLMLNEALANPRVEFSLGATIWVVLPVGLILWGLAIGWAVRGIRLASFAPGEGSLLICAAACALVSMGGVIPGVGLIWWLISHLPGLNMVRTPDRFIAIVIPVVIVAAVSSLEYLTARATAKKLAYTALGVVVAASFALFFGYRVFLGDTNALEERLPHLDRINAVAESRGNRATNLALVHEGSVFDTSLYAMMMPNLDFAADFTQRYEGDGLGGTGMLARANVATVIASPPWTQDSPLIAQSAILRANFLHLLDGDATSVAAYGVEPVRGFVHPVAMACLDGGPGMLDYLEVLPAFASSAFLPNGRNCDRTLYTDSAPAPAILGGTTVAQFPGTALFAGTGVLRDIDYRVALGRFFLNNPWYRNAIDGDSPQLSDGAVSLDTGKSGGASFALARGGDYAVALRAACHGTIHATLQIDAGTAIPFVCEAAPGFSWTEIPIGRRSAGAHRFLVTAGEFDTSAAVAQTTWHFGVDGVVVVERGRTPEASPGASAFAFSAARFETTVPLPVPAVLTLVSAPGFDVVPGSIDAARAMLLARSADAIANYRFAGTAGRYRVSAVAYADGSVASGTYLGILRDGRCCADLSSINHDRGPQLYAEGTLALRPGDRVAVVLHMPANDPLSVAQLLSVVVEPDPKPVRVDEGRSRYGAWFDFVERAKKYDPVVPTGPTPVPGHAALTPYYGLALWSKPATLSVAGFPSSTQNGPTAFSANLVGGGSAIVRLTCGANSATARLTAPGGDVTLGPSPASDCRVDIASRDPGFYLKQASITRAIAAVDLRGTRWIAAGTYRAQIVRRGGEPATGTLFVDGRATRGLARIARSGFHVLLWSGAPPDAFMVAMVPVAWPQATPGIAVTADASQRWSIHLDRTTSLEGAVLSDDNWRLTSGGRSVTGASCDLENTCFANVPPGDYRLWHAWPGYVLVGFAITLLAWFAAGGLLVTAVRKARV